MSETIWIAAAARTPMGAFQGDFASLAAHDLGGVAIGAALTRADVAPQLVDEVLMGNCLMAGQGQAPARQAAIKAGLPMATGAVTLSKMCGSGMKAAMLAHDMLRAGSADVMIAGGMESMTQAPYLLPKARGGYRMGHGTVLDHMMLDGLEDAYEPGRSMGTFGEDCAAKYGFTRAQQDAFAMESVRRAQQAIEQGAFADEIAAVEVASKGQTRTVDTDEGPGKIKLDKIPTLRPAFKRDGGTITAASSSSINDGAAALVLMTERALKAHGVQPLARVVGHATHAQEPNWFTTAPVDAMRKLFAATGWQAPQVDLFEINEAFAVVPMAAMHELQLPHERVNVHGGACALGHPIGASGARIMVTLLYALRRHGLRRGVASLCIGGGEATAMALELV
ncbi:MAG: acetyl-CoA C-acyltransferase [Proteobacteria bacterium]|nr:acetyl-CoA C-acyltransferase [Pseudomonadota bacterium]